MSKRAATAALDEQIRRIRTLPSLVVEMAPAVARVAEDDIKASIAAATAPDGKPWPATIDGHKPLQGAAKHLSSRAVGSVVVVRIDGVEALHHLGAVKGGKKRPILPTSGMPQSMTRAVESVATKAFRKHMGAK